MAKTSNEPDNNYSPRQLGEGGGGILKLRGCNCAKGGRWRERVPDDGGAAKSRCISDFRVAMAQGSRRMRSSGLTTEKRFTMTRRSYAAAMLFAVLTATPGEGQGRPSSVPPMAEPITKAASIVPTPPTLRRPELVRTRQAMDAAERGALDSLRALKRWNEISGVPHRNGFSRPLREPIRLESYRSATANAGMTNPFSFRVAVDGAQGVRLHATGVSLPPATELWVWADNREPIFFDRSLVYEGELWTPIIWSDHVYFEIRTPPGSAAAGTFTDVVQVFDQSNIVSNDTSCYIDSECVESNDTMAAIKKAVAMYSFVKDGNSYVCSGTLLNDRAHSGTPHFLTASHCVSSPAEASTVHAYWDYLASSCGGSAPLPASLPQTVGATLLASSSTTDVTLLRLSGSPGGRWFLGWHPSGTAVSEGSLLYRISHPGSLPQKYSVTRVTTTSAVCDAALPRPQFYYSVPVAGGAFQGSSGGAAINNGGYVVGQLWGGCGPGSQDNPCDTTTQVIDGALSESWPILMPFLDPQTTCSACLANNVTACLLGNRFRVTVPLWRDLSANLSGPGAVIRYAENKEEINPQYGPISAGTYFSMYSFAPSSVEVLVRIIKGQNINNRFWVFATGFTGAEYTLRVEDTQTCRVWQRTIPAGATNVVKDFEAFPFP